MKKITIIGNLTRDPELRTTTAGKAVCHFTVAVNDKRGNAAEGEVDYFSVSVFSNLADICAKYLAKGRKVAVTGDITLRKYTTQDGRQGSGMNVTADTVEFLSGAAAPGEDMPSSSAHPSAPSGFVEVTDGELPF